MGGGPGCFTCASFHSGLLEGEGLSSRNVAWRSFCSTAVPLGLSYVRNLALGNISLPTPPNRGRTSERLLSCARALSVRAAKFIRPVASCQDILKQQERGKKEKWK